MILSFLCGYKYEVTSPIGRGSSGTETKKLKYILLFLFEECDYTK